jgi:hypothetical protein
VKPDMYPEFIEACRSVGGLAALREGEKVCIMADLGVESEVIYALFATARLARAEAFLCMVEDFEEWTVPDIIAPSVAQADVVFHSWPSAEGKFGKKWRKEKGQRWVGFGDCRTLEKFIGEATRIPPQLLSAIVTNTWKIIDHGQARSEIRITDRIGTDLTLSLSREELDHLYEDRRWQGKLLADEPGTRATLPSPHGPNLFHTGVGVFNETINGTVAYTSMVGLGGAYHAGSGESNFVEPVRITIENSQVMKVDGAWEAGVLRKLVEGGGSIVEIGMGFNPKIATYDGRFTGVAGGGRSGSLHIATGGSSGEHMDGCLFQATVTVNGRTIVDRGHLVALDAPEVVALAKQYPLGHERSWLYEASEERELQNYR